MHVIYPIRSCIDDMIRTTGHGMKAMILDEDTTTVLGVAYGRSDMLLREVYLIEHIDTISLSLERLNNLRCIVILRPTKANIDMLCQELQNPHYRTYYLYFTNNIGPTFVEKLAKSDEREVVRGLKEVSLDFYPISPFVFHLRLSNKTFNLKKNTWKNEGLSRTIEGLTSLLQALQINPLIRYDTQSELCKLLAERMSTAMNQAHKLKGSIPATNVSSLLLLLDRRSDLLTPLIHSWYYASMIYEEFKVTNNCLNLENVPDREPKDPKEMLLSIENDHFFRDNFNKNYGEIGPTLAKAAMVLKTNSKSQFKGETLADMKRFVEEYPETKRYNSDLHNHIFLVTVLQRIVKDFNIMSVSECEQEVACNLVSYSDMFKKLTTVICSSKYRGQDALRLVCLFALCYPDKAKDLSNLVKRLRTRTDITKEQIISIQSLQEFSRSKQRNPFDDTVQKVARKIKQGVKGVDNILSEYCPILGETLNEILRNNKSSKQNDLAFYGLTYRDEPPKRIIVYIVGGFTYEEALVVDRINNSNSGCKIVIGGDKLYNFDSFIDEVNAIINSNKE